MTGIEFAKQFVTTASEYVGEDRANSKAQIAKFLALFGLPFADDGVPVSYCAAGASYAAIKAYCLMVGILFTDANAVQVFQDTISRFASNYFLPSAACHIIRNDAMARGIYVAKGAVTPLPGWLVFYSFDGTGAPDHVEIVKSANASGLNTIGFNTSDEQLNDPDGGAIDFKSRDYTYVLGYATLYSASDYATTQALTPDNPTSLPPLAYAPHAREILTDRQQRESPLTACQN